ncbi:hypothetical protein LTR15_010163 [Elasticomyces elasticus]|nr:hypothetical protein LTR15_010163 [Elasticomyces elasticus]
MAMFVFKYRSLAALQKLHVVPGPPAETPLEERPLEDLSMEEMRELLGRQRIRRYNFAAAEKRTADELNIKKEIKRELVQVSTTVEDDSDIEIVEHRPKRVRTVEQPISARAVIDLCGDD